MGVTRPLAVPDTAGAGLVLTIDLDALVANWRELAARAAPAECAAVVKADAYGCGAALVSQALGRAGARTFFVALPEEGAGVRAALKEAGFEADIYVLNGFFADAADLYAEYGLRPGLGDMSEIARWSAWEKRGQAALHVDTGMNRLGLSLDEARALGREERGERFDGSRIALLMSHLACADEPGHALNAVQAERFEEARALFPDLPASFANSAGIYLGPRYRHDLVRPGIALYGGASHPDAKVRPVVRAQARILTVRRARAGETVGYGGSHALSRDSRIAILSAGYADGYLRAAGAGAGKPAPTPHVAIGEHRAPLVGRVSMDLIAVDVTDVPEAVLEAETQAEMFGPRVPIDVVAEAADTVAYEVLTRLSRRARRRYVGNGS